MKHFRMEICCDYVSKFPQEQARIWQNGQGYTWGNNNNVKIWYDFNTNFVELGFLKFYAQLLSRAWETNPTKHSMYKKAGRQEPAPVDANQSILLGLKYHRASRCYFPLTVIILTTDTAICDPAP